MKKILTLCVAASCSINGFTQSFEGTIEFKQQTTLDTQSYIYYIKGDKVRIDNISKVRKVEGSFIIDLKDNKMIFLSHERKLWGEQQSPMAATVNGKPEVTKTKNTKTIQGFKCTEYVVKNKDENTQISFWIASGKFDFFDRLLKVLNRKDKPAVYYQQITGLPDGDFPFLAVESPMDGKERGRLEVTKIDKKVIDAKMFEIPAGYLKFEK
jgi:hypothetical protein